jgi:DNA-binding GntR family transcriptional regulator
VEQVPGAVIRQGAADVERIAGILRQDITAGVFQPGEWLWEMSIASGHGCRTTTAVRALAVIRREGLARYRDRRYYALTCAATLEAASARMGKVLSLFRRASHMTPAELAAAMNTPEASEQEHKNFIDRWSADIVAAEAGTWQPAFFWRSCDDGLEAAGILRRIHDYEYSRRDSPCG